jgi:hypothetical protein
MNLPIVHGIEPEQTYTPVYVLESRARRESGTNSNLGTRVSVHTGDHGGRFDGQECVRLIRGHFGEDDGVEYLRLPITRRCVRVWREAVETAIAYAETNGLVREHLR